MAYQVKLNVLSKSLHTHGVVSGFMMLAQQGLVDLTVNLCFEREGEYPMPHMVEAVVDGKTIAFDMLDGYNFDAEKMEDYLSSCHRMFKRSNSQAENRAVFSEETAEKILPLGCSYHVLHPKADFLLERGFVPTVKQFYHSLQGEKPLSFFTPERFESDPVYRESDLTVLFYTRLWEEQECPGVPEEQLRTINNTRIGVIRELRKRYPGRCKTGVNSTPLARRLCPDLIAPQSETNRCNYLQTMKQSDVCIGSMGLHKSVGWKTGEYIAASRAIVNETFHYEMTGDFREGENYLVFSDVNSCMAAVERLLADPDAVFEMKKRNHAYYQTYLRPDAQVLRALERI